MNYLVLLRHGQSQWNLENRFTGFVDVSLSPKGEEEAANAGKLIKQAGIQFDTVFTSTLKRAAATAKLALENAGQEGLLAGMIAHDDLRERDYGGLTGLNKAETMEKYGEDQVKIWRRSYDTPPPKGDEYPGESLKDVVDKRVTPYYNTQIKPLLDQGKNVLVAAHGNSLRGMLIGMGIRTPENINETEIPTGSPLVFEFENGKIVNTYYLHEKLAA